MSSSSLIGSAEAANLLGITQRHVARLVASGDLHPATKVGNAYAFDRAYIEQHASEERRSALAAEESDAAQRRPALAAKKAGEAGYAIQDEASGAILLEARHVDLDGGDAA